MSQFNAVTPVASTGVPTAAAAAPAATFAAAAPAAAAPAGNAAVATSYDPNPVAGGGFGGDVRDGIGRMVAFASKLMQDTQAEASAEMSSEGGPLDAAKLQVLNSKMSMYEMTMQMAAKLQEKEERAAAVWVRP